MTPTVFVSGASGYIASHCIDLLLKQGYNVRGTVRSLKDKAKVDMVRNNLCPDSDQKLELVEWELVDENANLATAVKGCEYVLHVASPVYDSSHVKHESDMINPAVTGTVKILEATRDAGSVKRFVLTSSFATVYGLITSSKPAYYTEEDWPDMSMPGLKVYTKAKTLAEKSAWEFINALPEDKKFELVVINPGYVIGPPVLPRIAHTLEYVSDLLKNPTTMITNCGFSMVDVRDVAMAHVNALHAPGASGCRHIITAHSLWQKDIADILKEEFEDQGFSVARVEPDQSEISDINPVFCTDRMANVLSLRHVYSLKEMVIDSVKKLLEFGLIKKN